MRSFRPVFDSKASGFYTLGLMLTVASLFLSGPVRGFSVIGAGFGIWLLAWLAEGGFRQKFAAFRGPWLWPSVVLYFLYAAGILYSEDIAGSAVVIEQKAAMLLVPLLIGAGRSFKREHLSAALFTYVAVALVFAPAAVICALVRGKAGLYGEVAWTEFITYENLARAVGFQAIYLSFYLVAAIFALFALYRDKRFEGQWFYGRHFLSIGGMAVLFAVVVLLSSRMELLVLFVTAGLTLMVFVRNKKLLLRAFGGLFVIGLLGAALIFSSEVNRLRFKEMFDFNTDYKDNVYGGRSIRLEKWKNTIECWSQSPVFGVGTGDAQKELVKVYEKNGLDIAIHYDYNSHNQYLGTLLAIGIPGLLALLAWMGSMFWLGIKRNDWLIFAFGSVIAFSMISENMLQRQWGVVFIALFSTLLTAANLKYFSPRSTNPGS